MIMKKHPLPCPPMNPVKKKAEPKISPTMVGVYRLLNLLDLCMDNQLGGVNLVAVEHLGISATRKAKMISMLEREGLIETDTYRTTRITLNGLEYLILNPVMQEAAAQEQNIV